MLSVIQFKVAQPVASDWYNMPATDNGHLTKNTILSMVQRKSVLLMLQPNPTRVWDTFTEPNNFNNAE